jgi:branched-chain amino acid aminotransferase
MNAWTYLDGRWVEGNPPVIGPMSHAMWLSSIIFDGARAFDGTTPDLDRHCARAVRSAENMGMKSMLSAGEIQEIAMDGVRKFDKSAELYIRPMFFAETGWIDPDPASTRFMLSVYESPLPKAAFSASFSKYRRPSPETRADRCQGELPLSPVRPHHGRGEGEGVRQRHRLRPARATSPNSPPPICST